MRSSKKLAFSSILSALSVILMLIGSFFGSLDLTAAALASFCVILAVIEMGYKNATVIFAVSATLSMLLLPSKMPAVYFTVFLGYYPVVKSLAERLSKALSYVVKYLSYSVAYLILTLAVINFFPESELRKYLLIAYFVGAAVFLIYDLALTRIIGAYCKTLRYRLGIDKFFGNNRR